MQTHGGRLNESMTRKCLWSQLARDIAAEELAVHRGSTRAILAGPSPDQHLEEGITVLGDLFFQFSQ